MEVKDLLKDNLTEEEKTLLEIDTKKKKYKLLTTYLDSKKCKTLIEKYAVIGDEILEEIMVEIDKRRKGERSKATVSDLDKTLTYYDFQIELISNLGDSEAEKILKEDLKNSSDATLTHLTNKIEELYDVPSFSELDLLKHTRVEYALLKDKLELMTSLYYDKEVEEKTLMQQAGYESDEEFEAMTDVS